MSQQMCPPESQEKLSTLRAKTDRQVLDFIEVKLQDALQFVSQAEKEFSQGNHASAQQSLACADQSLGESRTLLVVFDESERRGLDRKLHQAAEALDRVCKDRELLRPLVLMAGAASPARTAF